MIQRLSIIVGGKAQALPPHFSSFSSCKPTRVGYYSPTTIENAYELANRARKIGNEVPRITDGEWTVMKVVWAHKTTTAKQVVGSPCQ